jgi:hypothetical protein
MLPTQLTILNLPRGILYPQRLALSSPTSSGRSVGIVPSRTQTTKFSYFLLHGVVWAGLIWLRIRDQTSGGLL